MYLYYSYKSSGFISAVNTALQSKEEAAKVDGMPFDVLLAEDNPVNRNIAIKFLKGRHHKVDSVENGQEAYEAFLAKKYDVILMVCSRKPLLSE